MNTDTARRLLELNRRFYAEFGDQFSATRQRIQPGVAKIIARLNGNEHILDLGCGNGALAHRLAQTGFSGTYTGLDFSLPLLRAAKTQPANASFQFIEADLAGEDWQAGLEPGKYNLVTSFATLHHIPSKKLQSAMIQKMRALPGKGASVILSNWQFLNSEKLRRRIQPWETVGISAADVDEGDYLLDWRSGGTGLRYAHFFTPEELNQLAEENGFMVKESFLSDGENGRLGLYQVWVPVFK